MVSLSWSYFLQENRNTLVLAAVIFAGITLMFSWQLPRQEQHYDIDSYSYQEAVETKHATGSFEKDGTPLLHPIGYASVWYAVSLLFPASFWSMIFIQSLLAFFTLLLLMHIAFIWYDKCTSLWVLALGLANVGFYIFPQVLLVEVWQLFFVAWAWECFFVFLKSKKRSDIVLSGLFAGLSLLFKPSVLHLPLLIIIATVLFRRKSVNRFFLVSVAWFLAAFYSPVLFMMARNWFLWGYFKFSYLVEENLLCYFQQQLLVYTKGYSSSRAWDIVNKLRNADYCPFDARYWSALWTLAKDHTFYGGFAPMYVWCMNGLRNAFGLYARNFAVLKDPALKMCLSSFFVSSGSLSTKIMLYFKSQSASLFVFGLGVYELLYTVIRTMFVGVAVYEDRDTLLTQLSLVSVVYCCGALCMVGTGRYRLVAEPLLVLVAARGCVVALNAFASLLRSNIRKIA